MKVRQSITVDLIALLMEIMILDGPVYPRWPNYIFASHKDSAGNHVKGMRMIVACIYRSYIASISLAKF